MATADELGVPLILTPQLKEIMISLKKTGHINDDHSSIVQFYEKISGVTVKSE